MDFSFAFRRDDDHLYALLNKFIHYVPDSAVSAALTSWSYEAQQLTVSDFFKNYIVEVLAALVLIIASILFLLLQSMSSEKRARESLRALEKSLGREAEQQRELSATRHKAYTDPLTGVKSKTAYLEMTDPCGTGYSLESCRSSAWWSLT